MARPQKNGLLYFPLDVDFFSDKKIKSLKACNLFMARCKAEGLDIFITETYRSQERQNYLYEQGRSRSGQIVTWTKSSRHTSRRAWDIACNGDELYDTNVIKKAGKVAADLGITWGGTWSSPDYPHFEISTSWKASAEEDTEVVKKSKIIIDGNEKEVEGILKYGTNYIKIRDIAEVLGFDISNKGSIPVLTKK